MARLAFFLPDLRGGGAERVALTLIEEFVARGHDVDLVLMRAEGEFLALLPPAVRVIDLKARRVRGAVLPFARYLRENRPDAVQVSMWPLTVAALIARVLARTKTRLVLSEHSTLTKDYDGRGRVHAWLLKNSVRLLYPLAEARIAVSHEAADDLAGLSGIDRAAIDAIYNPLPRPSSDVGAPEVEALWGVNGRRILSVGSLNPVKNHLLLVEAFAELRSQTPARLMIVGEGKLRTDIEALARRLGVAEDVILPGFHLDVWPFYRSADLFVLSSDHEGFGNVLVEAMSCGIPVVSTDCESGPREILDGGRFGHLVPVGDRAAMAAAMMAALSQVHDPEALKRRAEELTQDTFAQYERKMLPTAQPRARASRRTQS